MSGQFLNYIFRENNSKPEEKSNNALNICCSGTVEVTLFHVLLAHDFLEISTHLLS